METARPTSPFFKFPFEIYDPETITSIITPSVEAFSAHFPAMVTVQNFETMANVYLNEYCCNFLERTKSDLLGMGHKYYCHFFPLEEMEHIKLQLKKLVKKNRTDKNISFFQRIRPNETSEYTWFFTTSSLSSSYQQEEIYLLHVSLPINKCSYMGKKLDNIVEENLFIRKNHRSFKRLSEREKEIMDLISTGNSSRKISDLLCISIHTVNNHRKNIIHKIGKKNLFTFMKFNSIF